MIDSMELLRRKLFRSMDLSEGDAPYPKKLYERDQPSKTALFNTSVQSEESLPARDDMDLENPQYVHIFNEAMIGALAGF